jgi:hypothetical protein
MLWGTFWATLITSASGHPGREPHPLCNCNEQGSSGATNTFPSQLFMKLPPLSLIFWVVVAGHNWILRSLVCARFYIRSGVSVEYFSPMKSQKH